MRKLVILLHLILLIPGYSLYGGEVTKKVAQAGFKFMDVEISARAAGMGEAFSLIGDDANAIFHNPAGIAQMQDKKFDLMLCQVYWIAETSVDAVGLVTNLGTWGNLGISVLNTNYGDDIIGTIYDPDPENESGFEETGPLELGSYAAGITYARKLTDKFMIGGNVRYAYEHLGENIFANNTDRDSTWIEKNETNTIVCDIGTIFYTGFESLRFGMSIVNFSPAVQYQYEQGRTNSFVLPLTFRMGAAMDVLDLLLAEHPDYSLLVDFELVHPRDYTKRYHMGAELTLLSILKLRAGYKTGYDEEGFSVGSGIHTGNIKLDYAYNEFGIFDYVSRISLGIAF
jgi:hypothetical protein